MTADREALARTIYPIAFDTPFTSETQAILQGDAYRLADAVLASDWLREVKATASLEAVQRVIRKIDKSPAVTWTGQGGARHIAAAIERDYQPKEQA